MRFDEVMVYTDVDGTAAISINNVSEVSCRNISSCDDFIKNGGMFGVASGRTHFSIDELFHNIPINLPYIEANGASVWDKGEDKYLFLAYLNMDDKIKLYEYVKERPSLTLTATTDKSYKVDFGSNRLQGPSDFERSIMSFDKYISSDLLKAAIVSFEKDITQTIEDLSAANLLSNTVLSRSSEIYLELFNRKASKGNGIKKVIEDYPELNKRKLVCVGDYYNDISMLKIADIAICPKNAVNEVKDICDYIASSDDVLSEVFDYLKEI